MLFGNCYLRCKPFLFHSNGGKATSSLSLDLAQMYFFFFFPLTCIVLQKESRVFSVSVHDVSAELYMREGLMWIHFDFMYSFIL